MSTAKTYTSTGSYTRYNRLLPGSGDGVWRGADFSHDPALVDGTRLAYCVNMWRDYDCEGGGCIESFPGYRMIRQGGNGKMHGMWHYRKDDTDYIIIHCGTALRYFKASDRDLSLTDYTTISNNVNDADSQAFVMMGRFYFLDGLQYWRLSDDMTTLIYAPNDTPYAPITYSDEAEYEQRNMLTNNFIERWNIVDVAQKVVDASFGMRLSVSGSTVTITKINSTRTVVYIPSTITVDGNEYTDIRIADSAFLNNKSIKSVVIMGCSSIGTYAFKGCTSLRSVQILTCTSIGGYAFENCTALENVMIGCCTTIGDYAFTGCTKLVNAVILSCSSIGSSAFAGCTGLIRVAIHECTGAIGASAFRNCPNLLEVWAGSYTSISESAFGDDVSGYPVSNVLFMSGKEDESTAFSGTRTVSVSTNCRIVFAIVGSTVTTDFSFGKYNELMRGGGAIGEREFLTLSVGSVNVPSSENAVWTLPIEAPSPIDHLRFRNGSGNYMHFGITALPDGLIMQDDGSDSAAVMNSVSSGYTYNYSAVIEKAVTADFYILDPCMTVTKLTLNGAVTAGVEKSMSYTLISGTTESTVSRTQIGGISIEIIQEDGYWSIIRIYLASEHLLDDCEMRLYGVAEGSKFTSVKDAATYKDQNPGYTGSSMDAISKCTICTIFDGRPFFTGNPSLPNTVFYASRRSDTGVIDPTYIGVCSYFNDGTGNSKNNAMLAAGTTLMVFKEKSGENGSVFYHTPRETGVDFLPKDYPSTEGAAGFDCLGSACNFLDDYVFITAHGLDAVDKEQLNLERTIGHRSSNIDRILTGKDLSRVRMTEWKGYLVLLADGDIFLADSRKMFTNAVGSAEYEWFRLSGIGYYDSQHLKTVTATGDLLSDGHLITQAVLKTTGEKLKISE
ncbi:MAG: leucine-rich repeat domain-containing protein [Eubacteriales bacterium]